jgi:hypothetical protein
MFVLEYAAGKVAGDSGVEHMGSLVVRHDVDVEVFGLSHRVWPLRARSFTGCAGSG